MSVKFDELRKLYIGIPEFRNGSMFHGDNVELLKRELSKPELVEYVKDFKDDQEFRKLFVLYMVMVDTVYRMNGVDIIPDETYDELIEISKKRNVEIPQVELHGKYSHNYPELRGTLGKVHFNRIADRPVGDDRSTLEEYLNRVMRTTGLSESELHKRKVELSLKVDGVSAIIECDEDGKAERVLKRGDVERNLAERIPVLEGTGFDEIIPSEWKGKRLGIKTEVAMTTDSYKSLCNDVREFESPRSAVTSIVNNRDLLESKNLLQYLTIYPLQMKLLEDEDIKTIHLDELVTETTIGDLIVPENFESYMVGFKENHSIREGIPADGVVISFKDQDMIEMLGREDEVNRYEIAYKFPPTEETTTLIDVDFSIGVLGSVTPVAKVKPINIDGHTIDSPSLGSMGRFESLKLKHGQNVTIRYDVIPYLIPIYDSLYDELEHYVDKEIICSYCQEEFHLEGSELSCINPTCPTVVVGRITNYITKVGIRDISRSTVQRFHDEGILNSIEDLYTLQFNKSQLYKMSGFGEKSINKILSNIEDSRKMKDYNFYGSLGVRSIGRTILKKVFEHYPSYELIPDLLADTYPRKGRKNLSDIPGIGSITEQRIMEFVTQNHTRETINRLVIGAEVSLEAHEPVESKAVVTFTKVRDKELESTLEEKGYEISGSYRKKVDIVVVPTHDTQSSKVDKARKDGKEILTVNEMWERVKPT